MLSRRLTFGYDESCRWTSDSFRTLLAGRAGGAGFKPAAGHGDAPGKRPRVIAGVGCARPVGSITGALEQSDAARLGRVEISDPRPATPRALAKLPRLPAAKIAVPIGKRREQRPVIERVCDAEAEKGHQVAAAGSAGHAAGMDKLATGRP